MTAPLVAVVVQAKDGRWNFGRRDQEAALQRREKGVYASAADASQAATRAFDMEVA